MTKRPRRYRAQSDSSDVPTSDSELHDFFSESGEEEEEAINLLDSPEVQAIFEDMTHMTDISYSDISEHLTIRDITYSPENATDVFFRDNVAKRTSINKLAEIYYNYYRVDEQLKGRTVTLTDITALAYALYLKHGFFDHDPTTSVISDETVAHPGIQNCPEPHIQKKKHLPILKQMLQNGVTRLNNIFIKYKKPMQEYVGEELQDDGCLDYAMYSSP